MCIGRAAQDPIVTKYITDGMARAEECVSRAAKVQLRARVRARARVRVGLGPTRSVFLGLLKYS